MERRPDSVHDRAREWQIFGVITPASACFGSSGRSSVRSGLSDVWRSSRPSLNAAGFPQQKILQDEFAFAARKRVTTNATRHILIA